MTNCRTCLGPLLALVLCAAPTRAADAPPAKKIDFNRDVRPILSDHCFQCHGPDAKKRKADLRLDTAEGLLGPHEGGPVVVAGKWEKSPLWERLTSADPDLRMPPADASRKLTSAQLDLVRRWIAEGAEYRQHWSFSTPVRPPLPEVRDTAWPRNGLDRFVLARLEQEGLRPTPEAERTTLLRRLSLDLTGLPPTLAELDAFLADDAPDAYERQVERLLASPHFGEHLARGWLDAARYADTNGYQSDGDRTMWPWRDWVIAAFNANQPFDQFTIEQLAGDLLPRPTRAQRIATGFNRNHRGNGEGGVIAAEFLSEYVADRVETTGAVWLGLTLNCSRCHDHKFDPLSQRDFYQLFAFFHNVPERGKAVKFGNSPPYLQAPTPRDEERLAELDARQRRAEARFAELLPRIAAEQAAWERMADRPEKPGPPTTQAAAGWSYALPEHGILAWLPLDGSAQDMAGRAKETKPLEGPAEFAAGRVGQAFQGDGRRALDLGDVANFSYLDQFTWAAWIRAESPRGVILSRMTDPELVEGYSFELREGRLHVHLVKRWLDDAIRVRTRTALPQGAWRHVAATYDGSRLAAGIKVYVDGQEQPLEVLVDELNQEFKAEQPLRIGGHAGPQDRFQGAIDDVRLYARTLAPAEIGLVAAAESVAELLAIPAVKRTPAQALKLRTYFLEQAAPTDLQTAHRERLATRRERQEIFERLPTVMVMEELPQPRATHILLRGQYDKPGEQVYPGAPATLLPYPADAPRNRLGLAQWLVDPAQPLTARVTVNRFWQQLFGVGLVKTAEDFGSQGEPPSHPELLDWLATEFMRSGWDVKRLHRLIVTSATYRQASRTSPELAQRDPENRLLARGPRFRLSAEQVRDQALAASGLLARRVGGPSVMPYQPDGIWKDMAGLDYVRDEGEKLYRRSLYTFWKRTIAPPTMMTFDASPRETCVVRTARTNTPLQALALLNEVTFVEAARVLAERVLSDAGATPEQRLATAFRLATARSPRPQELQLLAAGLARHQRHYRTAREAAETLLQVGDLPRDKKLDPATLAAYTAVCGLILNLDEAITKE